MCTHLPRGARRPRPRAVAWALLLLAAQSHSETLEDAWRAALADNPSVRAAEARADGAAAELDAARAARRPAITANASMSRWADPPAFNFASAGIPARVPLFAGDSVSLAAAQLTMPLYTAGMLRGNIAAAAAGVTAGQRSAQSVVQSTKLAVAEAYVDVLRAASDLAAAQAAVTSLAAHERDAADMEKSGQVPRSDRLAAAVSLAGAELRRLQAQNSLELARSGYNRRLGRPLEAAVDLAPNVGPLDADAALQRPLEELVAAALANRAELEGLAAVATAFDARAAAKRAERGPQLVLSGGYNFIENTVLDREDYWSVGLGVQWNLFDSGRTRSAAAALATSATAAARDRDDLRASIELEVRGAWLTLGAARARRGVAEGALAAADENLRVANDRYRNGEGTSSEALDAEALRTANVGNLDAARYDAALAEARLARAAGIL